MLKLRSRILPLGLLATVCSSLAFAQTAEPLAGAPPAGTPPPARGNPPPRQAGGNNAAAAETMVGPIKFGDITIDAALDMLERWSGRAILRPAGLPATSISFSLNQRVTRAEAQQALETLLTMNGIAVTPLGDKFLKVTPLNTARTEAPELIEGSTLGLPPSGHIATKLFQLRFLRVAEFAPQISGLLNVAAASPPVLFEKTNSALITDTVSNLQRIETLINQLDQPSLGGLKPKFYKVHSTTASELVTKLQSILSGSAGTQLGSATSFQADDRTNQIILISDERQHEFFDDLIEKLDTAGESSTRQEVIQLKHADATEMATLLSTVVSGQTSAAQANQGQTQAMIRSAMANMANRNQNANNPQGFAANQAAINAANAQVGNNPGTIRQGQTAQARTGANANAPLSVVTGPNGNIMINNAASAPQQFSEILTVAADVRSNSLVVSGTVDDMRLIKELIQQLDILLAQVRIEVVIAEVTLSDQATSGIDSLGLIVQADKVVGFYGSAGGSSLTAGSAANPVTLVDATTGARSLSGTLGLSTSPRKNNANILSVPNIVTTHNKEATIFVGEERPVITSYLNTGTTGGTIGSGYSSNVTYKEIGISLTVKPLIGNDGSVQLDIKQEVNDILGEIIIDNNSQPRVGSRKTESFVSAKSGEIIVLGGLQRKSDTRTTSRLGGIPLIGDLLGRRTRENTRTDLVFFLRPYVLTNTEVDNEEALRRLQTSPQKKDVDSALQGSLPVKNKR